MWCYCYHRETIEEATSVDDLQQVIRDNREQIDQVMSTIASQYQNKDWEGMAQSANRLQYLTKADYEAREKLDILDDQRQQPPPSHHQVQQQAHSG